MIMLNESKSTRYVFTNFGLLLKTHTHTIPLPLLSLDLLISYFFSSSEKSVRTAVRQVYE